MGMAEKGKAAVYRGLGKPMEIEEFPVPDPEPGAVVVKLNRANVCGSDLHMWRGDLDLGALGAPLPVILGHEMTGQVARMGEGVSLDSAGEPLQEGDRVVFRYFYACGRCKICLSGDDGCCPMNNFFMLSCADPPHFNGAYGEYYYLRPNHTVFKVPDELTDDMVAPINCALSEVIYGLEKVGLRFGESIVIQGAGGLGIYATALAKEMGASKVIVIDGIDDRLELAKAFGADEVIDMKQHKTSGERVQAAIELTGGGADVVAELVGFADVIPEGLDMLGSGGRLLEIGNISPGHSFSYDPAFLVMYSKSIIPVGYYSGPTLKKALDFMFRTRGKYPFERILSRSYPLEDIERAFADQDKGLVSRAAITF
jgi:D-arabinose 1-dehydrogenase-like Zn-dependent alcohol dehydrogenase